MAELDQAAGVVGGRREETRQKSPPPYVMPDDRAELENERGVRMDRTGREFTERERKDDEANEIGVSPILVNQSYRNPEMGPVVEADGRPVSR